MRIQKLVESKQGIPEQMSKNESLKEGLYGEDRYLYHATDEKFVNDILRNGLLIHSPNRNWKTIDTDGAIHFAFDAKVAEHYATVEEIPPEKIAVLKVKLGDLDQSCMEYDWNNYCEYEEDINSVQYKKDIPAKCIEVCDPNSEPSQTLEDFEKTPMYYKILDTFDEEVDENKEYDDDDEYESLEQRKNKMTIEERKLERRNRLAGLNEAITNLPKVDETNDKLQGQMDVITYDIIRRSEERAKNVKDAFKEKNKEVREFVKAQDKATGASKEDASENRLFLDEDLFKDEDTPVNLKESKSTLTESIGKTVDKVMLVTSNGLPMALSNVLFMGKCNSQEFQRDLMEATSAEQFKQIAEEDTALPWRIFRDNDKLVALEYTDRLGNKKYLKGFYSKGATDSNKRVIGQILIANGVSKEVVGDVVEDILTALGIN